MGFFGIFFGLLKVLWILEGFFGILLESKKCSRVPCRFLKDFSGLFQDYLGDFQKQFQVLWIFKVFLKIFKDFEGF